MRLGRGMSLEHGAFLLEALVALLIFSFGLLAMAGLQARAVRHFNEAQYRQEAVGLVHATLATMRAIDPTSIDARFDASTDGEGWRTLMAGAKRLPGVSDGINSPSLTIVDGPSGGSRRISLSVFWQAGGNSTPHAYEATAVVGGR